MPLRITSRTADGVAILALDGRLVLGPEVETLRDAIKALGEQGRNSVLLDMKEVAFIDSTGLGVLVALHSSMKKAGGQLGLLHLSKRHIQLLVLTKLSTVFRLFDNERAAIDSFFPEREQRGFDILEFIKRPNGVDPGGQTEK